MSLGLFILLFFLGVILAIAGGIMGIVDAFRVSNVWGLLALLVPFALLVFCIKFWRERKWARNSLLTSLLGILAMVIPIPLLGGIGFLTARNQMDELEDLSVQEIPADPNAQPEATPEGDAATEGEQPAAEGEEAELFEEAMLPGLPSAAEIARAELLPSTDPNERVKEIEQQRPDPYAFVPIPPPPRPTPPPTTGATGNNAGGQGATGAQNNGRPTPGVTPPPIPTTGGGAAPPRPTGTASPGGAPSAGAPGGSPTNPSAGSPADGPLPDLPEPTILASQVEVSGIASVGGENFAIVKAPNEPTSRYVKAGDRIANGSVLVKRIENRPGNASVVVFEERGEEIALPVGSNMTGPDQEEAAESETASSSGSINASLPFLP